MHPKGIQAVRQILASSSAQEGQSVEQMRAGLDAMASVFPLAKDMIVEKLTVEGRDAEWLSVPNSNPNRTILYLHGGAFIAGNIDSHRPLATELAREASARVLLIDYRLAPEYPFPQGINDCVQSYRWLLAQGVAPENLAIVGDSAGGGLALSTLIELRDAKLPLPATAALISPWTDLSLSSPTHASKADIDPISSKGALEVITSLYLGDTPATHPLASPIFADLTGLPPLLIQVGTDEILLGDSQIIADRAGQQGVSAELEVWSEMVHVWHAFFPMLPEARQALEGIGEHLNQHWK